MLQPEGSGETLFHRVDVARQRAFAAHFGDRDPPVDRLVHRVVIVGDGECDGAAQDALRGLTLPAAATICYIGMGTDTEAGRHGLRWRLETLLAQQGVTVPAPALQEARDALQAPALAAHIVGIMPNMPANRISNQFDLRGAAHTVSAEAHAQHERAEAGPRCR